MKTKEIVFIQEHGLWSFLQTLEAKLKEGYKIDFESNEGAPTTYGTLYVTGLIPPEDSVTEEKVEKQTRKSKTKVEE